MLPIEARTASGRVPVSLLCSGSNAVCNGQQRYSSTSLNREEEPVLLPAHPGLRTLTGAHARSGWTLTLEDTARRFFVRAGLLVIRNRLVHQRLDRLLQPRAEPHELLEGDHDEFIFG